MKPFAVENLNHVPSGLQQASVPNRRLGAQVRAAAFARIRHS